LGQGKAFISMDPEDKREVVFTTLVHEARKDIESLYPGAMAFIKLNHKDLYDEILASEMRLDNLWLTMQNGERNLDQFREALKEWKDLHFKAVEFYRKGRT